MEDNEGYAVDFKKQTLDWAASQGDATPSLRLEFLFQYIGLLSNDELRRLKSRVKNKRRSVQKLSGSPQKVARLSSDNSQLTSGPPDAGCSSPDADYSSGGAGDEVLKPWWELYPKEDFLFLDCEFVSKPRLDGQQGFNQVAATVDVVDKDGKSVYSKQIKHKTGSFLVDDATKIVTGFTKEQFDKPQFPELTIVRDEIRQLFKGKLIVTHGGAADYESLGLEMADFDAFDLQMHWWYEKFNEHGVLVEHNHSLRSLAKYYFGEQIQKSNHTSLEDAKMTSRLFEIYKTIKLQDDAEKAFIRQKNRSLPYNEIPVIKKQYSFPKKKKKAMKKSALQFSF